VTRSAAIDVVDIAIQAVTAYQRDDLHERLDRTRTRLADPAARVLVVGEFKQGKSLLINSLVNAPACPVDDDLATAVPTEVRHAERPALVLVEQPDPNSPRLRRREVPIDHIGRYVSELGDAADRRAVRHVEVGLPRSVLAGGLCLVDTPGVGGLDSAHGASTMAALPGADAVILVSDAAQEYTAPELEFLRHTVELCPNVLCVLTKIDLYPDWRRIAELDLARLRAAGIEAKLIPVSSTLRQLAISQEDRDLNIESGFPGLIDYLRTDVVAIQDRLADRSAAHDVLSVTRQLAGSMTAELAALRDPAGTESLMADLARATERVEKLRTRSARWQQTLNDGVADLGADIDHDLRDRMRAILREAEAHLDEVDPTTVVDEFGRWLNQRVSSAASANFVWTSQRVRYLATQVATHFGVDSATELPQVRGRAPESAIAQADAFALPAAEKFGVGQKWITGMRGGYGGTLMVGMASTLAGLALLNPLSVAAGLMLGRKTVKDERKRLLQRRQAEAKGAVRRYVDDVLFQLGKESRDLVRESQRELRDHFTRIAEELSRSLSESTLAAQRAVSVDRSDRDRRIADLEAELARVENLAGTAVELAESAGFRPLPERVPSDQFSGTLAVGAGA
jgi:replication fork clamp-binding protein CrfC